MDRNGFGVLGGIVNENQDEFVSGGCLDQGLNYINACPPEGNHYYGHRLQVPPLGAPFFVQLALCRFCSNAGPGLLCLPSKIIVGPSPVFSPPPDGLIEVGHG